MAKMEKVTKTPPSGASNIVRTKRYQLLDNSVQKYNSRVYLVNEKMKEIKFSDSDGLIEGVFGGCSSLSRENLPREGDYISSSNMEHTIKVIRVLHKVNGMNKPQDIFLICKLMGSVS